MTFKWSAVLSLAAVLGLGCGVVVNGEELGEDGGGLSEDIAEYEELSAALEASREQALGEEALAVQTGGPWLGWLVEQTLNLRRYPAGLELELPLTITHRNYRISESHVSTAAAVEDGVRYQSVALATGELVDDQLFAKPAQGIWSPYVLLGDSLVVVEDHTVWRWRVGVDQPVALGILDQADVALGQIAQLEAVVSDAGDELLIVSAAGRLWVVELDSLAARSVAQLDELLAVGARGLLFTRADGLYLVEFDGPTTRIDTAIAKTGWALNPTFAGIHEYTGDGATLRGDRVYYIGSAGLFAYTLGGTGPEAITPILIEPRWNVDEGIPRVEYREPRSTADGTVLVRGLLSPSGEIGGSGPIYAVPSDG